MKDCYIYKVKAGYHRTSLRELRQTIVENGDQAVVVADNVEMEDTFQQLDLEHKASGLPGRVRFLVPYTPPTLPITPPAASSTPPKPNHSGSRDRVTDLVSSYVKLGKEIVDSTKKASHPSQLAKSYNYCEAQGLSIGLLDGRVGKNGVRTTAPPVQLYHPVFQEFVDNARDSSQLYTPKDIQLTSTLMRSLSQIATKETMRDAQIDVMVSTILGVEVTEIAKTAADFTTSAFGVGMAIIMEFSSELGTTASDPSVQVSFSYSRAWSQDNRSQTRRSTCCPTLLVAIAGPWMVVLGAVWTAAGPVVQRLTEFEWLGCSCIYDEEQVYRIVRIFVALRKGMQHLQAFYETEKAVSAPAPDPDPQFLHQSTFPRFSKFHLRTTPSQEVSFTYIAPLEWLEPLCVTFLARLNDDKGTRVVVKYVRRYGVEAHALLADHGLAPKLLGFEKDLHGCPGMSMVVMEYLDGPTLGEKYGIDHLPEGIEMGVRTALKYLREAKFIFPDLRRPNVMVVDDTDSAESIRLIDFDWVCKDGDGSTVPAHTSRTICEAMGAGEGEKFQPEHQDRMFQVMFGSPY